MGAVSISESTVYGIMNYLKTNLPTCLSDLNQERDDNKASVEAPKSYFPWEVAHAYRCPAIFVIDQDVDMRLEAGSNFIQASHDLIVSAVLEDRTEELLQKKCWRYQDAIYACLNNVSIILEDSNVLLKPKIRRFYFSEQFSEKGEQLNFRKEVAAQLEVEHYENQN